MQEPYSLKLSKKMLCESIIMRLDADETECVDGCVNEWASVKT